MKKRIIAVTVLAAVLAGAACLSGCNISTNSVYDMEQVVAEVDITASDSFEDSEVSGYEKAVTTSTGIIKRDLVAYFLNLGYSYVNSGYSYEDTFNMLLDALVENAVLTQYSIMYLLKDLVEDGTYASADAAVSAYLAVGNDEETDDQTKIARYTWLLNGGKSLGTSADNCDEVKESWYTVLKSLNSAIDNYESALLEDETSTSGTETRTTPGNVNTEKDDYYPSIYDGDGNLIEGVTDTEVSKGVWPYGVYYNVYTGNDPYLLDGSGLYQDDRSDLLKDSSTRLSRWEGYTSFIGNLMENALVTEDEDLQDVLSFNYIDTEFATQLEQQIITRYQDEYNDEQEEILLTDPEDSYVAKVYADLLEAQSEDYEDTETFTTDLSSMGSDTFLLYAPDTSDEDEDEYGTYGFVYNILLPFSTKQSTYLSQLQSEYKADETDDALSYKPEYYTKRAQLMSKITTTDQRSAWFNGATEYAFNAAASYDDDGYEWIADQDFYGTSGWLFFEKNLTDTDRYEPLEKYDGRYAYNGTVIQTAGDDYVLLPNELTIDDMLDEFTGYINWVLGDDSAASYECCDTYVNGIDKTYDYENLLKEDKDGNTGDDIKPKDREIDYSTFMYATGSVDIGSESELDNRTNVLKTGRDSDGNQLEDDTASQMYEVLSAVNELQYAYTTDTSVLTQYLGYSVATGNDTGYIGEFEYAAQYAIGLGAGHFAVCAGDYGWHLIYVTYTFDNEGGEQYDPDWSNYDKEGTFEYYFYEYVKSNDLGTISTTRRTYLLTLFNNDDTVTKYEKRYKDLLELSSD